MAEIFRSFQEMFQAVDAFSREALRRYGVTGPQLWALRLLDDAGALSVGDLAERLYLHISTVSGVVRRLERGGLIVRQKARADRRKYILQTTPAGRAMIRRAPEPPRSRLLRGLQGLGVPERRGMAAALARLRRIMRDSP